MSERDLKRKIFAAIEKIVRNLKIKEIAFKIDVNSNNLKYNLIISKKELNFKINTIVNESIEELNSNINSVLEQINSPEIKNPDFDSLNVIVIDSRIDYFSNTIIYDKNIIFKTNVNDLLRSNSSYLKLSYKTKTNNLYMGYNITTNKADLNFKYQINDNESILRLIKISKNPVLLKFIKEEEQLEFWKIAIIDMKKKAKDIKLLSVFKNMVLDYIEKLRYDSIKNRLYFNYRLIDLKKKIRKFDIAIFKNIDNNKAFMVKILRDE